MFSMFTGRSYYMFQSHVITFLEKEHKNLIDLNTIKTKIKRIKPIIKLKEIVYEKR